MIGLLVAGCVMYGYGMYNSLTMPNNANHQDRRLLRRASQNFHQRLPSRSLK
jgi:hypothetical protein